MEKLLIVDDDESLRRLMRLELGDTYEVLDSGEPQLGLALALEHRPDAILLDLRMPRYSGYELLQTYTSFSHTQRIPVIIVSGEAGAQTKEHCKQLGAAGYFEKPIDFEALRACLRQAVKTSRYHPRTEVRLRLRIPLRLKALDGLEKESVANVTTENVSLSGFLFVCDTEFAFDSVVAVYLNGDEYVGTARIVHSNDKSDSQRRYGCRFIEKTGPWVLR